MNIVTIKAAFIPEALANAYHLVPETHTGSNKWYKIVVMEHVQIEHLTTFIEDLKTAVYV
jgi:hypothetical protein